MPSKRECLECLDRDEFVSEIRSSGRSEIYARQMNRYIDEFLRFCLCKYGRDCLSEVSRKQLEEFARKVADSIITPTTYNPAKKTTTPIRSDTAVVKIRAVINWYEWLERTGKIEKNPAEGLVAAELLRQGDRSQGRKSCS